MNGKASSSAHMNLVSDNIQISQSLESKALKILNVKSPLDSPDFNPTDYINRLFPNGKLQKLERLSISFPPFDICEKSNRFPR
jgi:hypothetical protein